MPKFFEVFLIFFIFETSSDCGIRNRYLRLKIEFLLIVLFIAGTFSEGEMDQRGILKSMYRNKGSRIRFIPIEEKTRDLLYDFYEPYNNLLYDYLKDFRFRWQRELYSSYKTHLDEQFRENNHKSN